MGKSKIPNEILKKPTSLNDEEFEIIKKHSLHGYKILDATEFISDKTSQGVLTHHEDYDSSGYPLNLQGEKYLFSIGY